MIALIPPMETRADCHDGFILLASNATTSPRNLNLVGNVCLMESGTIVYNGQRIQTYVIIERTVTEQPDIMACDVIERWKKAKDVEMPEPQNRAERRALKFRRKASYMNKSSHL